MSKPSYFEVLNARSGQLMTYPFMTKEQITKAEKEWVKVKKEYIKC